MAAPELDDLQRDALKEIVNIGVGHSAGALSEIVDETVTMGIPDIHFLGIDAATEFMKKQVSSECVSITQEFTGPFTSLSALVFPEDKSLELVRRLIGDSIPVESLAELAEDALKEIGNIIISSCMAALADTFEVKFLSSLPNVYHVSGANLLTAVMQFDAIEEETIILVFEIQLSLEKTDIQGALFMMLEIPAMERLLLIVDQHLQGLGIR